MKLVYVVAILLLITIILPEDTSSQVTLNNGTLGAQLSNAGRLRVGLGSYSSSSRQISQLTPVAAWTQEFVFDYIEDGDSVRAASLVTIPGVDLAGEAVIDNRASFRPPKVHVTITAMTWTNQSYMVVRFRFFNDTTIAANYYLGAELFPRPGGTFGGETVTYDSLTKTAYFFRSGENNYWGTRLLGASTPYSVKIKDWDAYSSDPDNEVASDTVKYAMTADPGYDPTLTTAGVDGSVYFHNSGARDFNPGDSIDVWYSISYGSTADVMMINADSAAAKYNLLVTGITIKPDGVPDRYSLQQNYPNPFNPTTTIDFEIRNESFTTLEVYNTLGQQVATLVHGNLAPAHYSVEFDAATLPSGVYLYKLTAGQYTEVRRMLLVR